MLMCRQGYEIKPCRSAAGWYIGTVDEDGCPNCRLSSGYSKTEEECMKLPMDRQFGCAENEFCHGGSGCGCIVSE